MLMKRNFLITILAICSILPLVANGQQSADDNAGKIYKLKLGHIQPLEHPNAKAANKFAELVKEKTNGQLVIEVFPASQLGNEKDIFDSVAMGVTDLAVLGYGESAKRYKPALIFDAPFFAKDRDHFVRIFNDPIVQSIFDDMEKEIGVKAIAPIYYGSRYLTTSDKIVKNPSDLNGMKIRVPDQEIYVSTLKAMGATPVPIAFPEVYLSLQQGTIDGQENPPATIAANKFYEVQKYMTTTGHIMGGNCFYINSDSLNSLPEDFQSAILEAANEVALWTNDLAFKAEDENLELIRSNGVTIINDPDKEAFMASVEPLYKKYEVIWGEGLMSKIRSIK